MCIQSWPQNIIINEWRSHWIPVYIGIHRLIIGKFCMRFVFYVPASKVLDDLISNINYAMQNQIIFNQCSAHICKIWAVKIVGD